MPDKIGVSIVNYKTARLVIECIDSLAPDLEKGVVAHVVVVDNQSGDDSVRLVSEHLGSTQLGSRVEVIAAEKNGGFSYGNNIAFHKLLEYGCDYIWLLNPDTRVLSGAAQSLIACFHEEADAGVVGSCLQDEGGPVQIAAFNFPTPFGEMVNRSGLGLFFRLFSARVIAQPVPAQRSQVQWIAGASMMISADVIQSVGFMDELYFLYFEEVDYCRLITQSGYKIYYEPESCVVHHVGAATGISDTRKQAPRRPEYWFASRRRYFQKNFGFWSAVSADLFWLCGHMVRSVRLILKREKNLDPPRFLLDFIGHCNLVKGRIPDAGSQVVNPDSAQQISGESVETHPGLWALIKEDWVVNGRDWTRPGFRALAVYRFGVWRMGITNKWLRAPMSLLYRFLFRRIRNGYGIEFPYSIKAGRGIVIEHQGAIVVHGNVELGDGCIIRQGVTIGNKDLTDPFSAPKLGKNVNVGAGAKLLGSIYLGDGAAVGANAVVLNDVEAGAVVVGVPAKRIK